VAPAGRARGERIVEVGTDFQASSLDVLARARVTDVPAYLERIRGGRSAELALLSTCNRFELYAATDDPEETVVALEREVRGLLGRKGDVELVIRLDEDAVAHLVAVSAGLESALLGEHEILGQVRRARATAAEAGTAGRALNRLFEHALTHGRRIRRALGIADLRRSLTEPAVGWIATHLSEPERRAAVVVGAGETASQMAQQLRGLGIGRLTVLNRSFARSRELAEAVGGRPERFDRLATLLAESDLIVLATSAPEPLLTEAEARRALHGRRRKLLVVDLGLSANAEPGVSQHPLVMTLTLSDVVALALADSKRERTQTVQAQTLIREAVDDFKPLNGVQPDSASARAASTV
jgi:glutamyl-tRNA reductase